MHKKYTYTMLLANNSWIDLSGASCLIFSRYPICGRTLSHQPLARSEVLEAHCANEELIYERHSVSGARAQHEHGPRVIKQ